MCVLAALIQNFATSLFFQKLHTAVGRNAACPTTGKSLLASLAIFSRSEAALKRRKNLDGVKRARKRLFNQLALGKTSQARDTCQLLDVNPVTSSIFKASVVVPLLPTLINTKFE